MSKGKHVPKLDATALKSAIGLLIAEFNPIIHSTLTYEDGLRDVLRLINSMTVSVMPLSEMSPDQKREYYRDRQRACRQRKAVQGVNV